jgi:catechol 2,3-dioxygenase-like lactoylglutathione lyase family enzyme
MAGIHHVEVWVTDLDAARAEWGWLLARLGFEQLQHWTEGESWAASGAYITFTTSPNLSDPTHDRRRAGMNHIAFHGGSPAQVDALMSDASNHGWDPLYQERYPYAGGLSHYAGWLQNQAGFKAEVVAERVG